MAQIKFKAKDIANRPVSDVSIVLDLKEKGLVERTTDANGETSISGIEEGTIEITVTKHGYNTQHFEVEVKEPDQIISKEIILVSQKTEETPKEALHTVVHEAVGVVAPYIFNEPKTYEEAKNAYKEIENNIKSQKSVIEDAIKIKALDILQEQASNLTYTLGQQLTASIGWYVEQRSKLKPLESLNDLGKWASMSSMIGGLYLIREHLVEFINKVIERLEKGF